MHTQMNEKTKLMAEETKTDSESTGDNVTEPEPGIPSVPSKSSDKKSKGASRKKSYTTVPISRVNTIMRSCPNLTTVKNDAVALMSQAAELFVQDLVKNAYERSEDKTILGYDTLAKFVAETEYMFLKDAIPERITVEEYYEKRKEAIMEEKKDSP